MNRFSTAFALSLFLLPLGCSDQETTPYASLGIMVGEVTAESAQIQVRLCASDKLIDRDVAGSPGVVQFILNGDESGAQTIEASADRDFIARASFSGLKAGTKYSCSTRIGKSREGLRVGPSAEFKTLPGSRKTDPVKFVVVTGMNYAKFHGDDRIDLEQHLLENNTKLAEPYSGPDKDLGYPALEAILKQSPDFFVGTGDNVYYDTPDKPRASTISELRQKWHEQFIQPRYRDLFAKIPTYWMIDDHDYRIDDGDNSGDYAPSPQEGREMMLEQLPLAAHDDTDALTYRTHRVSRDLQIWLPENRMYRSDNATPDGPEKTIWGAAQKEWIKSTLSASDAKYKLFISPTPMVGPDDLRKTDNHTNHGGFRHERDEFFTWLKDSGIDQKHFYILCGDRHWQYHSVDPSGIEEFSCGALIDENARLGRKPGDPLSTDPEGLIKQPYYQTPKSGGFLQVDLTSAETAESSKLTFTWYDDLGEILHTTIAGE